MSFDPIQATPGLWRAGAENAPGVHALIVGISDYPFLSGGSGPAAARAPDNGGLGQLEVSALSGAMFFDWMVSTGEVGGAPLASCRLHLAPRPDETGRVDARTHGHYGLADYATLRAALDGWADEMTVAGATGTAPNIAVFFYSGHGVEVAASPAVLASDILNQLTAGQGANKAIAVDAMTTAIKTYNIDRGLFFVDACRDAPMAAKLIDLVGDQSLKPSRLPLRRPDALIRLQSTASGLKSYQVKDETGTLFTQAVLNGLQGPPPQYLPYDTTNLPWALKFAALEGHVKRMVSALLAGHSPLAIQSVEPYGNPYNGEMIVALKAGPPPDAGDIRPLPTEVASPTLQQSIDVSSAKILQNALSLDKVAIDGLRETNIANGRVTAADLFNFTIMHEVLGHEGVTEPWISSLQFLDARSGEPTDPEVARIFAAHKQEIDGRVAAWVDIAVQPGEGTSLWIGAGGGDNAVGCAIVVPRDLNYPIPVRLDLQFDQTGPGWQLRQMSARLADPSAAGEYLPFGWTPLFEAQRTEAFADLGSAVRPIEQDFEQLQMILVQKRQSPVAAAYATNLLLRTNAIQYLEDWPRNLTNWFEWLADGPVLWAETLLRRRQSDMVDLDDATAREALTYYSKIADRGVPLLANTLSLAIRQGEIWRAFLESDQLSAQEQSDLRAALEYVDRAGRYAVSGLGFARFVSTDGALHPNDVLRLRQKLEHEHVLSTWTA